MTEFDDGCKIVGPQDYTPISETMMGLGKSKLVRG